VNRPNAASRAGAGYRRDEDVTDELQGAAAEEGRTSGPAGDVEVAEIAGTPAHLVPDVSHLDGRWFAGVGAVGLSACASAPEVLV